MISAPAARGLLRKARSETSAMSERDEMALAMTASLQLLHENFVANPVTERMAEPA